MNLWRTLVALMLVGPLLIGVSSGDVYVELSGKAVMARGERFVEVPLALTVTNVRERIEIFTSSCRLDGPSGDRLTVEVDVEDQFGPSNQGNPDVQIPPSWETVTVPLILRCHRDENSSDATVHWDVVARARPRGGCTPSGCVGPDARIYLELR